VQCHKVILGSKQNYMQKTVDPMLKCWTSPTTATVTTRSIHMTTCRCATQIANLWTAQLANTAYNSSCLLLWIFWKYVKFKVCFSCSDEYHIIHENNIYVLHKPDSINDLGVLFDSNLSH